MSRLWRRAAMAMRCGRCGALIDQCAPVLMITIDRVHRSVVRCVACEGPAPELPPLVVPEPAAQVAGFVPVRPLLPLDWRRRAAGDEEE